MDLRKKIALPKRGIGFGADTQAGAPSGPPSFTRPTHTQIDTQLASNYLDHASVVLPSE
jgi:hypothetical protein